MVRTKSSRARVGEAPRPSPAAERFLRAAQHCRARDLERLSRLGKLVRGVSGLIHALQKERGASSIFLGSRGASFAEHLAARVGESRELEMLVRERLEQLDAQRDPPCAGARFYLRIAAALRQLDGLPHLRRSILAFEIASQDALSAFSSLIGQLLAVGFEAADIAADPATSRALVALVSFSQGKEFAGQERATAGAAFSRARFEPDEQQRLQRLIDAQQQAFRVFADFAAPGHVADFERLAAAEDLTLLQSMRTRALSPILDSAHRPAVSAHEWYEVTTRRIEAMKLIEDALAAALAQLCEAKLAEAQAMNAQAGATASAQLRVAAPIAMLVTDMDVGLYGIEGASVPPMRCILDVLEAQSRHIEEVSQELESARGALAQRTLIERARGILMKGRGLSEADAYALMRRTAMNQNRRLIEVAEAIVGMAQILES